MDKKFFCSKSSPVVQTKAGKIRGFYFDGIYNFWGVRYATAKRFEMPQPVEPWEDIKDALAYGLVCPLLNEPTPGDEVSVPHRFWPAGEDCLNLDVWTNTIDPEAKKPVMVWFHGGGYSAGSAIEHIAYEGDNLARKHDVVMVGVNHRLNAFGHLDVSAFGEKFKNSVNVGIADLVASLEWVRDNIAQFGGDPDNVTIFGQSGGGGKVTTLGQSPAADGLYHKAIVMSGVFPKNFGAAAAEVDPEEFVKHIMKDLRVETIEELQRVNFRLFIMAVNRAQRFFGKKGQIVSWAPHANYWYVGDPLQVGFRKGYKQIPTIVGTCFSEFTGAPTEKEKAEMTVDEQKEYVFAKYGKEKGEELLALYEKVYPGKNLCYAAGIDYLTRPASVEYVRLKSEGEHAPAYEYLFDAEFDFDNGRTAWHCADIPFFFANAERIPYCYSTPNCEDLNRMMAESFTNFAKTGNPDAEGMPHWECSDGVHVPSMVFGKETTLRVDHDKELLELARKITPPFTFGSRKPQDDEEEEGRSWIY